MAERSRETHQRSDVSESLHRLGIRTTLDDTNNLLNLHWVESQTRDDTRQSRVGRGDIGVSSVIKIEHQGL